MVGSLQGLHNTLIDWLEHWCCSTHLLRAGVASCGLSSFLRKISTFFWFVIRLLNCNIQALERSFVIHAFMLADLTTGMIFTCCTMQGYFDFPINSSFFFFFFFCPIWVTEKQHRNAAWSTCHHDSACWKPRTFCSVLSYKTDRFFVH